MVGDNAGFGPVGFDLYRIQQRIIVAPVEGPAVGAYVPAENFALQFSLDGPTSVWTNPGLPTSPEDLAGFPNPGAFTFLFVDPTCTTSCNAQVTGTASTITISTAVETTIDIKPGSDPNSINPRKKGVIPVAILGSVDFDATQVDVTTVEFGTDGATSAHNGHVEDVNTDGFPDFVVHFKAPDTGIVCGDTEATLIGETSGSGGGPFEGTDAVKTAGCK